VLFSLRAPLRLYAVYYTLFPLCRFEWRRFSAKIALTVAVLRGPIASNYNGVVQRNADKRDELQAEAEALRVELTITAQATERSRNLTWPAAAKRCYNIRQRR
jgi:hypothetical protein